MSQAVRLERRGPVSTLILCRPERRNAVDRETAEALARAAREVDADPSQRALVLWGEGGSFCAGADLKEIAAGRPNRTSPEGDAPMGLSRLQLNCPVIAAIAGHAVAGGLELALWCDLRVMEQSAVLGVFCRRVGVPLIDGGTVRLPRLIGLSRAMDLILSGRPVLAEEARAIGLVHRVVPDGQSRHAAESLAQELCAHPPAALRADLAATRAAFDRPVRAAMRAELEGGLSALEEGRMGARTFISSRAPEE